MRAGATYRVTGKNDAASWWQIEYDSKQGWVSSEVASVAGNTGAISIVQVAPPPTAVPQAASAAPVSASSASYPAAPGSFGYGIQIDPWGDRGRAITAIKGMGFGWVKVQIPWKNFEGSQGDRGYADDIINQLSGAGLNVLASIVKAPDWARPGNTDRSVEGPPANPQTYADYVGAFAAAQQGQGQGYRSMERAEPMVRMGQRAIERESLCRLVVSCLLCHQGR